jgi:hypothetical protein
MLITKAEIIARAFTRQVSESRIPDDIVTACETKYLKTIIGGDFYDAIVATPASYTTLLTSYIKPLLAWRVRYMLLPELRTELSDLGILTIQVKDASAVDNELFAQVRDNTLIVCEEKEKLLTEYLVDNSSSYPLYYPGLDPVRRVDIKGGIIMDKRKETGWIFDDGPEKWNN